MMDLISTVAERGSNMDRKQHVLCLGDSNTYGFDPCSPFGGRYSRESRWTGILNAGPDWTVYNCGMNGREIPYRPAQLDTIQRLVMGHELLDAVTVMLGSNDLLQGCTAQETSDRMERFLLSLCQWVHCPVLLIAPPPMQYGTWVGEERLIVQSRQLGGCYKALAQRLGVLFADAAAWNISLSSDGLHFTAEGHRAFAASLGRTLENLI